MTTYITSSINRLSNWYYSSNTYGRDAPKLPQNILSTDTTSSNSSKSTASLSEENYNPFLSALAELEQRVIREKSQTIMNFLGDSKNRLDAISNEKDQIITEIQNQYQKSLGYDLKVSDWQTFTNITQNFNCLSSIALGATAIATTGATIGAVALIASGVVAAGVQIASHWNLWDPLVSKLSNNDKNLKEKYLWHINAWSQALSFTATVSSQIMGGALITNHLFGVAGSVLQSAIPLSLAYGTIRKSMCEKQKSDNSSEITKLNGLLQAKKNDLENLQLQTKTALERLADTDTALKRLLQKRLDEIKTILDSLNSTKR
jgi:hypothetical protein